VSLTPAELANALLGLGLLLIAAHAGAALFARFRQPPVIGEIVGGLLCGPTIAGALMPDLQSRMFPDSGPTAVVLGAVFQLGLLLLMFVAGAEVRTVFHRGERRTASLITISGTLLPFLAGLVALQAVDLRQFHGSAANDTSFLLVFASAMAVTSIPVISRIMHDLGILETAFARIVLTAAVIEDVALYLVLAVALGIAQHGDDSQLGFSALAGLSPASGLALAGHVLTSVGLFGLCLSVGPTIVRRVVESRANVVQRRSPIAFQLALVLTLTGVCLYAGVTALFGALIAGMLMGVTGDDHAEARESIKRFAFAFFVPVYFAGVGLRIDLIHAFDAVFFLGLLAFACVVKSLGAYGGARIAGETRAGATNLAVAMNARGGPGIVLASVAFDAHIIDERFFVALVLLAILTSLFAGAWLGRVVRLGAPLLGVSSGGEAAPPRDGGRAAPLRPVPRESPERGVPA
jgi:Kef-type K+ transport system membrane component KefB